MTLYFINLSLYFIIVIICHYSLSSLGMLIPGIDCEIPDRDWGIPGSVRRHNHRCHHHRHICCAPTTNLIQVH